MEIIWQVPELHWSQKIPIEQTDGATIRMNMRKGNGTTGPPANENAKMIRSVASWIDFLRKQRWWNSLIDEVANADVR